MDGCSPHKFYAAFLFVLVPATMGKPTHFLLTDDGVPPNQRIIDGEEAKPYEFPWIVEIRHEGHHVCGGTIINENYIMTAAHCVDPKLGYQKAFLEVRIAEHNVKCVEGVEKHSRVAGVKLHDQYISDTNIYDIAILRVEPTIKFNSFVRKALLPPRNMAYPDTVVVAGWGVMQYIPEIDLAPLSDKLRKALQFYQTEEDCRQTYPLQFDPQTNVCYGGTGDDKGDCKGDSGGPVHCRTERGWAICGIISFGDGCAEDGSPSVYIRVPNFLDWIDRNTNISIPWEAEKLSGCGGYYNRSSPAEISIHNIPPGMKCHWTFESEFADKHLRFLKLELTKDDEIWFTNSTHLCRGCKGLLLDPKKADRTFTFQGSSVFFLSIFIANKSLNTMRSVEFHFTSSGDPARLHPITELQHYSRNEDFFQFPKRSSIWYYNNQNVVIVIAQGISSRREIRFNFTNIDISNASGNQGCPGDHLSFYDLVLGGTYREVVDRVCGTIPSSSYSMRIEGFLVLHFESLGNSGFGRGFSAEYTIT